jgi:hypothetical protein
MATNLIIIHENVEDIEFLKTCINENTILYNGSIPNNNITHLALMYHPHGPGIPFFGNDKLIPTEFIEFVDLFPNLQYIDLLTCRVEDELLITELNAFKIPFRYSIDDTGNGNNWILESHNVNVKYLYFNDNINQWNYILATLVHHLGFSTYGSPFVLEYIDNVPTGNLIRQYMTKDRLNRPINQFYDENYNNIRYSNIETIITWGLSTHGANSSAVNKSNIVCVLPSLYAYAALKSDGSVVAWGHSGFGGSLSTSINNVRSIYSTYSAFAVIHNNGNVSTWGASTGGGNSSAVQSQLYNITAIYSTSYAFAAVRSDGELIVWGDAALGGTNPNLSNVATVATNYGAFAALHRNGTVSCWGSSAYGAQSVSLSNVKCIYATNHAFAALHNNGSVSTWGVATQGGNSSTVQSQLYNINIIYGNRYTFAALRSDGAVIIWGTDTNIIISPSNLVSIATSNQAMAGITSNGTLSLWGASTHGAISIPATSVRSVFANVNTFAAIRTDNTVFSWGSSATGGSAPSITDAIHITSSLDAYTAIRSNGNITSWGNSGNGGTTPTASNITMVYANYVSFVALKAAELPPTNIIQSITPEITDNIAEFTAPPATLLSILEPGNRTQAKEIATELFNSAPNNVVRASAQFFPIDIPKPFVKIMNQPIISTSTLSNDEALYIISSAGDTHDIFYNETDYITFENTGEYYTLTKSDDLTITQHSYGDTITYNGYRYILGSIIVYPATSYINFVLPITYSRTMEVLANILSVNIELPNADCIAVMEVSLSSMNEVFKFQTDASDIDPDGSNNDITYSIHPEHWPYTNIAHASTHITDLNKITPNDITTYTGYPRNRSLLKHDYVRYLAEQLFNTHHGVDLFNNEKELKDEIVRLGDIVLDEILQHLEAAHNLTNATTTPNNIGYVLMKQIGEHSPERFAEITDTPDYQPIPLRINDTIIFNVVIHSAESQPELTEVDEIPGRTYRIVFKITETPDNVVPDD